jgi:hypothetical protein
LKSVPLTAEVGISTSTLHTHKSRREHHQSVTINANAHQILKGFFLFLALANHGLQASPGLEERSILYLTSVASSVFPILKERNLSVVCGEDEEE